MRFIAKKPSDCLSHHDIMITLSIENTWNIDYNLDKSSVIASVQTYFSLVDMSCRCAITFICGGMKMFEATAVKEISNVKPVREIIYNTLRQAILNGAIKPGDRLVQRELAEKFKISRMPIRDALRKLEAEGFIEHISHKGMIVRGFNVNEIEEIYQLRQHLECLAIEACIKNISESKIKELKTIIYALEHHDQDSSSIEQQVLDNIDGLMVTEANMPILKDFLQTLRERLHRYRTINVSHYARRISAIQEHKEILKAIVARDLDQGRAHVICHIQNSYQQLKKSMDH